MTRTRLALVLPAAVLLAALAGCSGNSTNDASGSKAAVSDTAGGTVAPGPEAPAAEPAAGSADLAATTGGAAQTGEVTPAASRAYQAQAVISKGTVQLRSKDVDATRDRLRPLLATWGATIANEQSATDSHGHTDRQHLEIRVPAQHFDAAMDQISGLATLVARDRTSEDVTTQVIDTAVRVKAQRASLDRVEALLAQAQGINQVIAIESQLTRRQADLDSLEQQQAYLTDQTTMATIELTVTRSGAKAAPPAEKHTGFLGGLAAGWDELGSSTTAVLTAVGAVLPFALVGALVAVPLWWVRRRRAVTAGV